MHAIAFFVAIGVILSFTRGMFDPTIVFGLLAAHLVFAVHYGAVCTATPHAEQGERGRDTVLAGVVFMFTLFLAHAPGLMYGIEIPDTTSLRDLLRVAPLIAGVALLATRSNGPVAKSVLAAAVTILLLVLVRERLYVLRVSPKPAIDVWTSSQDAMVYFLDGKNPYTQHYSEIYGGRYGYAPAFPYWPGYLYWAALFYKLVPSFHDVRISLLVADVLAMAALFALGRAFRVAASTRLLLIAAWLSFPVALFIVEQAWIDGLLVFCFALGAWAIARGHIVLAGAAIGYAVGTKQYAIFGATFAGLLVLRTLGWRVALRFLGASLIVFALLVVPFVWSDWHAFWEHSVQVFIDVPPRPDGLSLPSYLVFRHTAAGSALTPAELVAFYKPWGLLSPIAWLASMAWLAFYVKRPTLQHFFIANVVTMGFTLLGAKQAFCNYYYYVAFFALGTAMAAFSASPHVERRA